MGLGGGGGKGGVDRCKGRRDDGTLVSTVTHRGGGGGGGAVRDSGRVEAVRVYHFCRLSCSFVHPTNSRRERERERERTWDGGWGGGERN